MMKNGFPHIQLSPRLHAVAELILRGVIVADVGTDHAYLPVFLVTSERSPRVIASDCSPAVCRNAQLFINNSGLNDRIEVRLGDGLSVLHPDEAEAVVCAGMGGRMICAILDSRPELTCRLRQLVLQPQKNAPELRDWLASHGWRIDREMLALDNGFYYQIISAVPGKMTLDDDEREFGPCLLQTGDPLFYKWLSYRRDIVMSILSELNDQPSAAERITQLTSEWQRLDALIKQKNKK